MSCRNRAAGLEVNGRSDADHLGNLVVTDEAAGGLGVLGVDINGTIYSLTHSGEHLKLNIADRVNGVGADAFKKLCRAGVAVTCVCGNLEVAVCGDLACLAELVECPEAALVIYEEAAAAEACGTLYVLNGADDLFLTAQAIAHAYALIGMYGCRSIGSCTGADCKDKVGAPVVSKLNHLADLIIGQAHDALSLGNAMQIEAVAVHCFKKCLHNLGALNAGYLKTELAAVSKTLLRCGQ